MAHPMNAHRQHAVEKSRVARIAKGYAAGGGVDVDATQDRGLIKSMVKKTALKMQGDAAKSRADRPGRARGGRAPKAAGKTNVNVIIAPQGSADKQAMAPPTVMSAAAPGQSPGSVPPPMPGAPPPGIRRNGGRAYATGGAVKDGPAWKEGRRLGTQVQHAPGKDDGKDIGRPRAITYKTGGAVEAPSGKRGMGPKFDGGGGGGIARLEKAKRAARK